MWRLEWRIARGRPRRWAWSVAVPLLLLVPVAASGAAPAHRATVYALLVVFFGLFGAAAPTVRDAERGWIERLVLTGYSPRAWLLERTAAQSVQDLLQLTPALAAVLWLEGAGGPLAWIAGAAAALLALAAANLLGTVVAAVVRSLAEGALVSAAVGLAGLHLAGAFRTPAPGSWQVPAAAWNPFRPALVFVREAAGAAVGLRGAAGATFGALDPATWAASGAVTLVFIAGAWAAGPALVARLTPYGSEL